MKKLIKMPDGSYVRADLIMKLYVNNRALPHLGHERFDVVDVKLEIGAMAFKCDNAEQARKELDRIVHEVNYE